MEVVVRDVLAFTYKVHSIQALRDANKSESYVENIFICNWIFALLYVFPHECISHTDQWDLFGCIHDAI